MHLHELMGWVGPMTHRQFRAWYCWQQEQWIRPSKEDYYLMQIAAEVRRGNVKEPNKVQVHDLMLKFKTKATPPPVRSSAETRECRGGGGEVEEEVGEVEGVGEDIERAREANQGATKEVERVKGDGPDLKSKYSLARMTSVISKSVWAARLGIPVEEVIKRTQGSQGSQGTT